MKSHLWMFSFMNHAVGSFFFFFIFLSPFSLFFRRQNEIMIKSRPCHFLFMWFWMCFICSLNFSSQVLCLYNGNNNVAYSLSVLERLHKIIHWKSLFKLLSSYKMLLQIFSLSSSFLLYHSLLLSLAYGRRIPVSHHVNE